ncbi:hypothetical protein R6Q59_017134 [Mikania micrantha]
MERPNSFYLDSNIIGAVKNSRSVVRILSTFGHCNNLAPGTVADGALVIPGSGPRGGEGLPIPEGSGVSGVAAFYLCTVDPVKTTYVVYRIVIVKKKQVKGVRQRAHCYDRKEEKHNFY